MEIKISIPTDEDGFIEMECDYCNNRFMLHESVYSDEANLHFFCPICGLPNGIGTFYCQEVLEAARRIATNMMYDQIQKQLGPTIRKINRTGFLKMSLNIPKQIPEKELYAPAMEYILSHQDCCGIDVKTLEFDFQIGLYCPICGGTKL